MDYYGYQTTVYACHVLHYNIFYIAPVFLVCIRIRNTEMLYIHATLIAIYVMVIHMNSFIFHYDVVIHIYVSLYIRLCLELLVDINLYVICFI